MPPLQQSSPKPVPKAANGADEVQLCVMVAPDLRDQVRATAAARGLTLRSLVLKALRDAGVLPGMADADLADRRAVLAANKARLWREHAAAASLGLMAPDALPPRQEPARKGSGTA